mmetsp:Transcript_47667/g.108160  ORF Transcript_47667/g.108160 Transcript_47667/m.108160 type:complete len:80 (-) Transcript_47667:161-400(-)
MGHGDKPVDGTPLAGLYSKLQDGHVGLMPAIDDFVAHSKGEWAVAADYQYNNGFLVLRRTSATTEAGVAAWKDEPPGRK